MNVSEDMPARFVAWSNTTWMIVPDQSKRAERMSGGAQNVNLVATPANSLGTIWSAARAFPLVVVQEEHISFLEGMEVDYVEDGLTAAFHFNNPNVTEQCGCGESFTVN